MSREVSRRAVRRAMAFDRRVLAVTQRREADDNPSLQGLDRVGVTASVIARTTFDEDIIRLLFQGLECAAIVQLAEGQFLTAEVAPVEGSRGEEADAFDLSRKVQKELSADWNADPSDPRYARFSGDLGYERVLRKCRIGSVTNVGSLALVRREATSAACSSAIAGFSELLKYPGGVSLAHLVA